MRRRGRPLIRMRALIGVVIGHLADEPERRRGDGGSEVDGGGLMKNAAAHTTALIRRYDTMRWTQTTDGHLLLAQILTLS